MARYLSPRDLGTFGLIASTVALAVYAVGFDYYTVTTRELVRRRVESWGPLLADQLRVNSGGYALAVFAAVSLAFVGFFDARLVAAVLVLTLLDHLGLEFNRLLVARRRPIAAHVVMALRSGVWGFAWSAAVIPLPALRSLGWVLWLWGGSSAAAVALGAWLLRDALSQVRPSASDRQRVARGLRVAATFLVSSLAVRAQFALDRYILGAARTLEEVGVYTVYIGMANVILLIVESGVVAARFPDVVASLREGRPASEQQRELTRRAAATAGLAFAILAAGSWPVLGLFQARSYQDGYTSLVILGLGVTCSAASLPAHYVLYGRGADGVIVRTSLLGLVVMVAMAAWLTPLAGLRGAALATTSGLVAGAFTRQIAARRAMREIS